MTFAVRKTMGNAAILALVAALGGGAVTVYRRWGNANPYGGLLDRHKTDPNAQVTATGVKVREYHDGKLVTQAEAGKMTIGQDGSRIVLSHVKNGVAHTPQGTMQFAGGQGVLNPLTKTIEVSKGARVKGSGTDAFDISTSIVSIDLRKGDVNAPHPLEGVIGGGKFSAASMIHTMNTEYTKVRKLEWKGKVNAPEAPSQVKDKLWRFTGESVESGTQDRIKAKDPVEKRMRHAQDGWATDGELVITAPRMDEDPETGVVTAVRDKDTRVTYRSAKADVIADKVVVYQKEHRAVCTGRVLMYVRPKSEWDKPLDVGKVTLGPLVPDIPASLMAKMVGSGRELTQADKDKIDELRSSKNLRDYPMQMAAEEVTYWYQEGDRRAVAKGGTPTAFQKLDDGRWRQAWAPTANYDGEKDMLDLVGSTDKREVHMKNAVGDTNDCYRAKISTAEDNDYVYMKKPNGAGFDFDADGKKDGAPPAGGKAAPPKAPPAGTPPTKPSP